MMSPHPSKRNVLLSYGGYLVILGFFISTDVTTHLLADENNAAPTGRTAIAHPVAEWDKDGKPVKIEFDFGDFKAWARRDGAWNANGTIHHRGLLCGSYSLSFRVGHGNPGCTNVKWFGDPYPVASTTLCNNATGTLSAGNTEFRDAARFDEITCAERSISCDGKCK